MSLRPPPASGLARQADNASRRVRVSGLPEQTQEPLLQQALEKIIEKIVRVSITEESHEAVVELETPAVSCPSSLRLPASSYSLRCTKLTLFLPSTVSGRE